MNQTKKISFVLLFLLIATCLAGFSVVDYTQDCIEDTAHNEAVLKEHLKRYEEFGMVYNSDKDELYYNGKLVRWFEDYYELNSGERAGIDFFNENGVVDVYAVRDLSNLIQHDDGSFDPSGKVVGLKEFSDKEFAERDINSIKNPLIEATYAGEGGGLTADELQAIAGEYAAFGVTYDTRIDQWYFNGEKVRVFRDVLTSNGESFSSGKFHGTIRTLASANGTIDIYTVRDFANLDASGNGTLTSIEKFSQAEFDERTQSSKAVQIREVQTSSGECTVIQQ